MAQTRLILLGAGHAHLLLTEQLEVLRDAGIDPLLIAPKSFDYSGLTTGVLSGALPPGASLSYSPGRVNGLAGVA